MPNNLHFQKFADTASLAASAIILLSANMPSSLYKSVSGASSPFEESSFQPTYKIGNTPPTNEGEHSFFASWKRATLNKLSGLRHDLSYPAEERNLLSTATVELAQKFISSLSDFDTLPMIGVNDDGSILLEWSKRNKDGALTMASIILNSDSSELVFSLLKKGKVDSHGVMSISESSFRMMGALLEENFSSVSHVRFAA